jgi:hypothetical protein
MTNLFSKARAEPVVRAAAINTQVPEAAWVDRIETLSGIVQYRVSATCITMLGTAILAKALNPEVNLFWFKPTHVDAANKSRSYSARTLCHAALVPLSAEYGFSLGVSGREPLNNQPFFRMERLDDGTPVNPAAQAAFDYMMTLIGEVQSLPNSAAAERALHAFIAVRRRYMMQYATAGEATIAAPAALIEAVAEFMLLGSAGGSHAQAIAAGVMDAALEPDRVESGRINDPSRHYPGDVCIWTSPEREAVARAIEVRDKPVRASDIHIFARRCQSEGVQDCGVLMVSQGQPALDEAALAEWADALNINLRLWCGWGPFIREALFWSESNAGQAAATAATRARVRLIEAEVSAEALENWDALTVRDIPA